MRFPYFIKTPWWLKKIYKSYVWSIPSNEKVLYLTFDDGPHPVATPFALDVLKKYNAKATFFCIGKNVVAYPGIYKRIIDEGHAVGNHTFNHLNGWKTDDKIYINDIAEAAKHIDSSLFRPPYGKIKLFQAKQVSKVLNQPAKVIMWDVLSADFDERVSQDECLSNVVLNAKNGSIIVFHDSEKALAKMCYAVPNLLDFFTKNGFHFESMNNVCELKNLIGIDKL
ncbi:MAG: polysaccharide deacetylase family protein [Bacteroidetes bacterium]|nr:polysaccharide deacetylase family protein [Bacteroidota bacterium]